ncbi:hypothetical protein Y1Q_0003430 [Alligator mississippiensis]|uniref:Uncharacterized protein n=1 Tax=Alligator mississippiensis TaxID=8496 RepID=A0A151N4W8_ALLMI|nr:hypothetical protein Y1Q_0003430 [Alligator mississippiensis]
MSEVEVLSGETKPRVTYLASSRLAGCNVPEFPRVQRLLQTRLLFSFNFEIVCTIEAFKESAWKTVLSFGVLLDPLMRLDFQVAVVAKTAIDKLHLVRRL